MRPSSTAQAEVEARTDDRAFYFSCNPLFVDAFVAYYKASKVDHGSSKTDAEFFMRIWTDFRSSNDGSTGYIFQAAIDEPGLTAALMHRLPVPHINRFRFFWMHQSYVLVKKPPPVRSGKVDLSMYFSSDADRSGMYPLVLCEVSCHNDFDQKRRQLFNEAYSTILYQMKDGYSWPLMGLIFNNKELEVHIYFKSESGKVVDITLFQEQECSVRNWAAVFVMLETWALGLASAVEQQVAIECHERARVCRSLRGDRVYKIFDYRNRQAVFGLRRRCPDLYFDSKLIAGEVDYLLKDEQNGIIVISYPYLEGNHTAKRSKEFRYILKQLSYMHTELHMVHGDIRLMNMIFNHDNHKASSLIDYDYCGKAQLDNYAAGIIDVPDGWRCERMLSNPPGRMHEEDDWICMTHCMRKFRPHKKENSEYWNELCDMVMKGEINDVSLKLKKKIYRFELVLELTSGQDDDHFRGTGSPGDSKPALGKGKKRRRKTETGEPSKKPKA